MSTKLIALAAGAAALIAAAGSANALPPSPAKQAATTQAQQAYYNPHARPYRVMSHGEVRSVLRQAGYQNIRGIHFEQYHVVRVTRHGHASYVVYRGPAYVAVAVAPNGRRYQVAISPITQRPVGRTAL